MTAATARAHGCPHGCPHVYFLYKSTGRTGARVSCAPVREMQTQDVRAIAHVGARARIGARTPVRPCGGVQSSTCARYARAASPCARAPIHYF